MYIISIYFEDEDGDLCQLERGAKDRIAAESKANAIRSNGFNVTDNNGTEWLYGPHRVRAVSVRKAE